VRPALVLSGIIRVWEMLSAAVPSTRTPDDSPVRSRVARWLSWVLLTLLGALLVEVLLEAWVQTQLATVRVDERGRAVADLPEWPKTVKNALYLLLAGAALAKVAVQRRWREFLSLADLALVALAAVMVVAGLAGRSPLSLIGEAVFVYLRGVIVFYAWRALAPSWRQVRPVLWGLGVFVVLNAALAVVQMAVGSASYRWLGWVDMTWANIYRAHALLDHPNHLGHLTGLSLLGLLAWFVTRPSVGWRWWLLYGLVALGMSATQSRESAIGFFAGAVLIGVLRRGRLRTLLAGFLVVAVLVGGQVALNAKNRAELQRRLLGVFHALVMGSGEEPEEFCVKGSPGCTDEDNQIEQREIRVLYAQQGAKLLARRPILGYGVGQFGGIVAYKHDPQWYRDPRFGPGGFNTYNFNEGKQVDSFWLHLVVETGLAGLLAYLLWLFFLALPLLRSLPGQRRPRIRGPTGAPGDANRPGAVTGPGAAGSPFAYWALAALTFAGLIAVLSTSLEDPLFPPLLFTILGLAWADLHRPLRPGVAGGSPGEGSAGPAGEPPPGPPGAGGYRPAPVTLPPAGAPGPARRSDSAQA
jgi:hypothetical protein